MSSDSEEERPPAAAARKPDEDMDDSDEDMEVPYNQDLGIVSGNVLALEPLRPGDVIVYNHPISVAGKESIRVTQVLATDPGLAIPLSLANGEFPPADTYVRRIREYKDWALLIAHLGISRPIEDFRLRKRALTEVDKSGLSRFQKEMERLRGIILNTWDEDIGLHSIRKGAESFCANGTTGGPSFAAVCVRADWSMGILKDRYVKNMEAGDQVVGRTVSGLNVCTVEYIVSPRRRRGRMAWN
jgi:hypothetical protein